MEYITLLEVKPALRQPKLLTETVIDYIVARLDDLCDTGFQYASPLRLQRAVIAPFEDRTLKYWQLKFERKLATFQQILSVDLPFHLMGDLVKQLLGKLQHKMIVRGLSDEEEDQMYFSVLNVTREMVIRILLPILRQKVLTYDLSSLPKCLCTRETYSQVYHQPYLKSLMIGPSSEDISALVINALPALKGLVVFCMAGSCRDEVVTTLVKNCPRLEVLCVPMSRQVTDRSLTRIGSLPRLRMLELLGTSVTACGCRHVLQTCPGLRQFDLAGVVDCEELLGNGVFNITKIYVTQKSEGTLHLITRWYPKLEEIELVGQFDDLSPLMNLDRLRSFSMTSCNFQESKVAQFFKVRGKDLMRMEFSQVDGLDLALVRQLCPNVGEISVQSGTNMLCRSTEANSGQPSCQYFTVDNRRGRLTFYFGNTSAIMKRMFRKEYEQAVEPFSPQQVKLLEGLQNAEDGASLENPFLRLLEESTTVNCVRYGEKPLICVKMVGFEDLHESIRVVCDAFMKPQH